MSKQSASNGGRLNVVGHPGNAPGFSPSQAARISIFLVPENKRVFENRLLGQIDGRDGCCPRYLYRDRVLSLLVPPRLRGAQGEICTPTVNDG